MRVQPAQAAQPTRQRGPGTGSQNLAIACQQGRAASITSTLVCPMAGLSIPPWNECVLSASSKMR